MDAFQIAIVGIIGTLLGVVVTSLFGLFNTRIVQNFENRKHRREVATKIGLEYWKSQVELAKFANTTYGTPATIVPPDAHMIHMIKLMDLFEAGQIDQSNLEEKLSELTAFTHAADDIIRKIDANRKLEKRQRNNA